MSTRIPITDVPRSTTPPLTVPAVEAVRSLLTEGASLFGAVFDPKEYLPGVDDEREFERLRPGILGDWHESLAIARKTPIESCSPGQLIPSQSSHPLIDAVSLAYNQHYPLSLSPDAIWLTIAQGFSRHINEDPERYRHRFVAHQGRERLTANCEGFVKGSPDNPWPEIFAQFSTHILEHIGAELHDLLSPEFSTTGPIERVAFAGVLMETLEKYFEYEVDFLCGIPEVVLEGDIEDWIAIRDRAARLEDFDLEWWIPHLLPILDEFIAARRGRPNRFFWSCIYKWTEGSMCGNPDQVQGWILNLFPYLSAPYYERNEALFDPRPLFSASSGEDAILLDNRGPELEIREHWLSRPKVKLPEGVSKKAFPNPLSQVPFRWREFDKVYDMELLTGLVGSSQNPDTLAVRPEIGWAVRDVTGERNAPDQTS